MQSLQGNESGAVAQTCRKPGATASKRDSDDSREWAILAEGIHGNDSAATKKFYEIFNGGFRFLLKRQLGLADLEDNVQECIVAVIDAVRKARLREPDRFVGFVHTIVKRHIAHQIVRLTSERQQSNVEDAALHLQSMAPSPESIASSEQMRRLARAALDALSSRDREMLRRFYLLGQSEEQIRRDMNLGEHVFKNVKHRAKNKFAEKYDEISKQHLVPRSDNELPPVRKEALYIRLHDTIRMVPSLLPV
jgi:RNA polymerase sigma factor (sigma-70 family)